MKIGNSLQKKILKNNKEYNFYKEEYEKYISQYQSLIKDLDEKNNKKILIYKNSLSKINELIIKTDNLQKQLPLLEKALQEIKNVDKIYKVNKLINIINTLKMNEKIVKEENKYLKKTIEELRETNEKYKHKQNDSENLLNEENNFYKKEYENILKREEQYHNIINELLENNLISIQEKQKLYENIIKEYKLQKLNIAYVLSGFPTLSETFVLNELRWLVKHGYNVKVLCYNDPPNPIKLDFNLDVIRFDKSGNPTENLEKLLIKHDINLIHSHFVFPTGTLYTYPLATKLKIPFTLFAHAFDIFVKENDKKNNISEISKSKYCKGIFTLSNYHKNYLMSRDVPENKIILTRQATEYQIHPLKENNRKIKKIVSISRFVEKKGIDTLIETAKILENENYEFSIYGFGILENELKNQIKKLKLKNIKIKGSLENPKEVKKVFDTSDLLVSPCRIAKNGDRDGIPTVMFESMAYGVPVLTTNVSAIPEVIIDGENGFLVKPNNPYELARKIREINSKSPEEIAKIRKNAQFDVQNISSINKTMTTLLNTWATINKLNSD